MSIPDFQTIMLPLLDFLSDGEEHTNKETLDDLVRQFGLTEEDLAEMLPSGTAPLFANRFGWAKFHLKMAGLLEAPRRAVMRITQRGLSLLSSRPKSITLKTLMAYPEFVDFRNRRRSDQLPEGKEDHADQAEGLTPEEQLESAYAKIKAQLAADLLEKVKTVSPSFFERLVVELLVAMGYGGSRRDAGQTVGRSGDGGIDGLIKEDRLGLDTIYLQAKRWEGSVGRPEIQKFVGALQGQRAKKGVFITTSSFTLDAEDYVRAIDTKIVLIDGERLTELMMDHDIGVSGVATYRIKRVDSDYFEES
jgi:restriction system protein